MICGCGVAGVGSDAVGPGAVQSADAPLHVFATLSVYLEQITMVLVTVCAHGPRPCVHVGQLKPGACVDAGDGCFWLVAVLLRVVHMGMVVVVVMIGGVGRGGGDGGGVGPGPGGGV